MYVESIYNYFHDFRRPVKCATIKFEIMIEKIQSLKLCQMQQVGVSMPCVHFIHFSRLITNKGHPTPMCSREGYRSGQRWWERGKEEKEM